MKFVVIALFIFFLGCSSTYSKYQTRCSICTLADGPVDGLVFPDENLAKELYSQIFPSAEEKDICWYQKPTGDLELRDFDVGYIFSYDGSKWQFKEKQDYIILWHPEFN